MELVMILCAVTNSMGVKGGRLVKFLMLYIRLIIFFYTHCQDFYNLLLRFEVALPMQQPVMLGPKRKGS
jgi:hypothetical protein